MNIKRWMDLKGPHTLVNGIQASHMACKSPSLERDDNYVMSSFRGSMEWPDGYRYDGEFTKGKMDGYAMFRNNIMKEC